MLVLMTIMVVMMMMMMTARMILPDQMRAGNTIDFVREVLGVD